jgi:hypothetical protein
MSDGPQILVTAAEFSRIQELATRCEAERLSPTDPWPEQKWKEGLKEILGWRVFYHRELKELVIIISHHGKQS